MVSKDQAIGGAIFIVSAAIAILYILTLFYPEWIGLIWTQAEPSAIRFWTIAVPVFIAFVAIMGIGMWIGWTMATTPPPRPIEEITGEMEEEKKEEKKEPEQEPSTTEEAGSPKKKGRTEKK